jgi:uncharacterized protein (DUF433 family)
MRDAGEEPELFTPSEAAVIADVSLRDINRVIDERILPASAYTSGAKRRIRPGACPLIYIYFHTAGSFTSEERSRFITLLWDRGKLDKIKTLRVLKNVRPKDWTVQKDFFSVDFAEFLRKPLEHYATLRRAREIVEENPDILGGTPVIRGTRVPVYDIAASVAAGIPKNRILEAYPSLDEHMIDLAVIYAEATPPRGRPRKTAPAAYPASARRVARRVVRRMRT